jgi:hypothetical protein
MQLYYTHTFTLERGDSALPPFLIAKMSLGSCAEFINSAGVYKLPPEFINSCRSLKTSVPYGVCKLSLEFINSGGSLKTS